MPASLFQTPNGERLQIGIFGSRNAGKSSLINALAGQPLSIVSDQKGTTTDPVQKAMELLPIGPVVLIDTPGLDDDSALGSQRIAQTRSILRKANLALLVFDGTIGMNASDQKLLQTLQAEAIPYLLVANKCDAPNFLPTPEHAVAVSAQTGCHLSTLKEQIIACYQKELQPKQEAAVLLGDLVKPGDCVVSVTPIDTSAPKGRLILPQVQAIRDLLDHQACCLVTQPQQLPQMLKLLRQPPKLVVTDSQVFESVQKIVPDSIPLTSFSILFARYTRRLCAGTTSRRCNNFNCRRLHPSPAMRRHWNSKASQVDTGIYQKTISVSVVFRDILPGRFIGHPVGGTLRRLHAAGKRSNCTTSTCQTICSSFYQLWHSDCLFKWHFVSQLGCLSR